MSRANNRLVRKLRAVCAASAFAGDDARQVGCQGFEDADTQQRCMCGCDFPLQLMRGAQVLPTGIGEVDTGGALVGGSGRTNAIRDDALEYIESPGSNATAGVANPSRGATEVSIIRQRQQPGGGNPGHVHDREEVMIVTRGSGVVMLEEGSVTLGAGDSLIVPAQTAHQLGSAGDTEAEWLLVATAGLGFFHANGDRAEPAWSR